MLIKISNVFLIVASFYLSQTYGADYIATASERCSVDDALNIMLKFSNLQSENYKQSYSGTCAQNFISGKLIYRCVLLDMTDPISPLGAYSKFEVVGKKCNIIESAMIPPMSKFIPR